MQFLWGVINLQSARDFPAIGNPILKLSLEQTAAEQVLAS